MKKRFSANNIVYWLIVTIAVAFSVWLYALSARTVGENSAIQLLLYLGVYIVVCVIAMLYVMFLFFILPMFREQILRRDAKLWKQFLWLCPVLAASLPGGFVFVVAMVAIYRNHGLLLELLLGYGVVWLAGLVYIFRQLWISVQRDGRFMLSIWSKYVLACIFLLMTCWPLSNMNSLSELETRLFVLGMRDEPVKSEKEQSRSEVEVFPLLTSSISRITYFRICEEIIGHLKASGAKAVLMEFPGQSLDAQELSLIKSISNSGIAVFGVYPRYDLGRFEDRYLFRHPTDNVVPVRWGVFTYRIDLAMDILVPFLRSFLVFVSVSEVCSSCFIDFRM